MKVLFFSVIFLLQLPVSFLIAEEYDLGKPRELKEFRNKLVSIALEADGGGKLVLDELAAIGKTHWKFLMTSVEEEIFEKSPDAFMSWIEADSSRVDKYGIEDDVIKGLCGIYPDRMIDLARRD
ncbi:MAG: hypothetical protein AAF514_13680, partial [Verrucomicrobiota bacterium]